MYFIIDANILSWTCRGIKTCRIVLDKVKTHSVPFNKDIYKEYKSILANKDCIDSGLGQVIKEWIQELIGKFGKKVEPIPDIPRSLQKLINRRKFPKKDAVYVRIALNCINRKLVSKDRHFLENGKKCIENLGINIMDDEECCNYLKTLRR